MKTRGDANIESKYRRSQARHFFAERGDRSNTYPNFSSSPPLTGFKLSFEKKKKRKRDFATSFRRQETSPDKTTMVLNLPRYCRDIFSTTRQSYSSHTLLLTLDTRHALFLTRHYEMRRSRWRKETATLSPTLSVTFACIQVAI